MSLRAPKDRPNDVERQNENLERMLSAIANLNDNMGQVSTGMKSLAGIRQMATNPTPVLLRPTQSGTQFGETSVRVSSSPGVLYGVSFIEPYLGEDFAVRIRDGIDSNGGLLWSGQGGAVNGHQINCWFPGGISYGQGLVVELGTITSPTPIEGVVYRNGGVIPQ